MKNTLIFKRTIVFLFVLILLACSEKEHKKELRKSPTKFDTDSLIVKESSNTKKVRGQVLYLPIYSNVPYFENKRKYDLSAFVAIHNTDFKNTMKVTKVLFFDNDGIIVSNYLKNTMILQPLGATNFFVPEKDRSGTGANFIIEWVSDSLINEPLIESVMIGLSSGQGVSFLSNGRIIRELR
jgi:hypothetical protein